MKKKISLLKIIIVIGLVLVLTGGCVKISEWPRQLITRFNLPSTIEPSHPLIQELNSEYNDFCSGFEPVPINLHFSMFESTKKELERLERFIVEEIDYVSDLKNEDHNALEHIPTVTQVLQSGQDDCDGIAIVTCSLLIARGYNSYVTINDQHAWIVTNLNDGSQIEILRYDYNTPWIIKWNHRHIVVNLSHPAVLAGSLALTVVLLLKVGFPVIFRKNKANYSS